MNSQQKNNIDEIINDPELLRQLKSIVLERTQTMPNTLRISIGSEQLTKEALMGHIRDEDEIGKQMMAMELGFLQALSNGSIYTHE